MNSEHGKNEENKELDSLSQEPMSSLDDGLQETEIVGLEDIIDESVQEEGDASTSEEKLKAEEDPHNNAILEDEYTFDPKGNRAPIEIPGITSAEYDRREEALAKIIDPKSLTKEDQDYIRRIVSASGLYPPNDHYSRLFKEEDREFYQGVKNKEGDAKVGIRAVDFSTRPGELSGEVALLKISRQLGIGDVVSVPLPHSGLWVTIKPPTERELVDLYNTVFRKKMELGRITNGLTLSNYSSMVNEEMFNFIMGQIHSINNKDITRDNLRDHMLIHDYHILAWGLMCSIYPNGFDYQRTCVNETRDCEHVVKGSIHLPSLLWIDNRSLTELQKTIMYDNRAAKLSKNHYDKYLIEHTRTVSRVIDVGNGIKFHLKVPTFSEHVNDGNKWVSAINNKIEYLALENYNPNMFNKSLSYDGASNEEIIKEDIFNHYVRSSILNKWRHYVDYIEIGENVIKDSDTIDKALTNFSSDDNVRDKLLDAILKFQEDTTIALVGIPSYKCPSCEYDQNEENSKGKFKSIIPLDVLGVSFLLLTSKTSAILEREV